MVSKSLANSFLNIFSVENEYEEYTSDTIEFYTNFINVRGLIKAEIISHETKRNQKNSKQFIAYLIAVTTTNLNYEILKRYSEFNVLNKKLEKKERGYLAIENFPKKKLWGNFEQEVIESRKAQLNEFLANLTTHYEDLHSVDFLEFLEIKKRYYLNGKSINAPVNAPKSNTDDDDMVVKLIEKLNFNTENMISTFNELDAFFFQKKPKLTNDIIKYLLQAEKKTKGLIHVCGKCDDDENATHHICSRGLRFLSNLLDHEYNRDAETYIKAFMNISPKLIGLLKFSSHILGKAQRNCKPHALRLLDIYIERNPTLNKEFIENMLDSAETFKEYEKWKNFKVINSKKVENYEVEGCDPINQTQDNHKPAPQIRLSGNLFQNHNSAIPSTSSHSAHSKSASISEEKEENVLKKLIDYKQFSWVDASREYDCKGIKIKHSKKGEYVKISLALPLSPNETLDLFTVKREKWDNFTRELRVLQKIDSTSDIVYEKFKWIGGSESLKKHIVYISKRTIEKVGNNEYSIMKKTVERKEIELKKHEILGHWLFLMRIKKYDGKKDILAKSECSKIKIVFRNYSQEAVSYLSSELLGESRVLIEVFKACKNYSEKVREDKQLPEDN